MAESYYERWPQEGDHWIRLFDQVDPWLSDFAAEHHMEITKWHWDAPDRTLSWGAGIERDLHIVIEGSPGNYVFIIAGAAWHDTLVDRKPVRYVTMQDKINGVKVPVDEVVPLGEFQNAVMTAYQLVSSWGDFKDWEKVDLPLPPS